MLQNVRGAEKLSLLLEQSRYKEVEELAKDLVELNPEEVLYKYYLALSFKFQGRLDEADAVADILLTEEPGEPPFIQLKAGIDIDQERLADAEARIKGLLETGVIEDYNYQLLAQVKFRQNNYDKCIEYLDLALELDAENIDALNMKAAVTAIIGDPLAESQVEEALHLDPNNSYAIANHATQLLNAGKIEDALERYKEALVIEPENAMAIYGLKEAMRSKFLPYRWLYQFKLFMTKLSGGNSWAVIIGAYLFYRFILRMANNNPSLQPFLYPIVGIILLAFISTWILEPLMNFTLLNNKYGKLLLDEDEKKSAMITGMLLILGLISAVLWLAVSSKFMLVALVFMMMMLPAGSFLLIKGRDEKKATYFGIGLLCIGLLAIANILLRDNSSLVFVFFIGIFIYQFAINAWMVKMSGRTFGD